MSGKQREEFVAVFLFFNYAAGKQARLAFHKEFKHCNTIVCDGTDTLLFDFDQEGIKGRVIQTDSLPGFINRLTMIPELTAIVCVSMTKRKCVKWTPWWVRSCNELSRYVSGVDVGLCFNPIHFYKKLLRYDGKRNYRILSQWRR